MAIRKITDSALMLNIYRQEKRQGKEESSGNKRHNTVVSVSPSHAVMNIKNNHIYIDCNSFRSI